LSSIGLTSLEGSLSRVGRATSLTRVEVNKLFNEFQAGMRVVSIGNFESIMKRIQSIVGSNAQEMSKMQGALANVSQKYPVLYGHLSNIAKAQNKGIKLDQKAIEAQVRNLYFIGKISDAQYKQLSSYLSANNQIASRDKKRNRELQRQVEAMNEFRRQIESVGMAVGQYLMPMMVKIADLLDKWRESSSAFMWDMVKVAAVISAIKFAKIAIGAGARSLMGGGGGGSGGVFGGGISRAIRGITPVYIVGMAPGVMLGMGAGKTMALSRTIEMGAGAKTGAGATVAELLRRAGKRNAAWGAGLMLAGEAIDYGSNKLITAGYEKSGGAGELVGSATTITGAALVGAGIGQILIPIPILGAAIGAGIGAGAGALMEGDNVWEGIQNIRGKGPRHKIKVLKEREAWFSDYEEKTMESLKKDIEEKMSGHYKSIAEGGGAGIFEDIGKQRDFWEKKKKQTELTNVRTVTSGGEVTNRSIKMREEEVALTEKELELAKQVRKDREDSFTKSEKKAYDSDINKLEKILDIRREGLELAKDQNITYQEAELHLVSLQGQQQKLTAMIGTQREWVAALGNLYGAQVGTLEAMIQKMSGTGVADEGAAKEKTDETLKTLYAQRDAAVGLRKYIEGNEDELISMAEGEKEIPPEVAAFFNQLKSRGVNIEDFGGAQIKTSVKELLKIEEKLPIEATKTRSIMVGMYDDPIKGAELLAAQQGLMVSLADNFAIGVKASAGMRIKQYEAQGKHIEQLKKERALQMQAINDAKDGEAIIAAKNKLLEIDNKILSVQIQQAQGVKALRDGWVSALSAQNTAMGGFTDIVMTAENGVAQIQRLAGSQRFQKGGAFSKGDDDKVGYEISEVFGMSPDSDLATVSGGDRQKPSYKGTQYGDLRNPETNTRKSFTDRMQEIGDRTVGGGAEVLGAGNRIALPALVEQQSMGGADINVNVSNVVNVDGLKNLKNALKENNKDSDAKIINIVADILQAPTSNGAPYAFSN